MRRWLKTNQENKRKCIGWQRGRRCCSSGQMRKNTEGVSGKTEGGVKTVKEGGEKRQQEGKEAACTSSSYTSDSLALSQPESLGSRAAGEQIAHGMLHKSDDTVCRDQIVLLT